LLIYSAITLLSVKTNLASNEALIVAKLFIVLNGPLTDGVDYYVAGKGRANLLAIDIKKAYDRVDHIGLFIKFMNRKVPLCFSNRGYQTLQYVLSVWVVSRLFSGCMGVGVRQDSSLAPILFSILINDVVSNDKVTSVGYLFAFADDILLISLSVCTLQLMLSLFESELLTLDLRLNVGKCCAVTTATR
jgi:hypothetical protein